MSSDNVNGSTVASQLDPNDASSLVQPVGLLITRFGMLETTSRSAGYYLGRALGIAPPPAPQRNFSDRVRQILEMTQALRSTGEDLRPWCTLWGRAGELARVRNVIAHGHLAMYYEGGTRVGPVVIDDTRVFQKDSKWRYEAEDIEAAAHEVGQITVQLSLLQSAIRMRAKDVSS